MSLIKKCRSVNPNHLAAIGPTICCPHFFSFCVWKVSCDLQAPEGVVLFSFEVWLHIWKSTEDTGKLWLMRMEQSQIVQSFDCSEWLCQWWLLKGQTCGLIFDLVLFVHLNGALVHNIKWYFSLMHHLEQFKFWCILNPFGSSWFCKQLLDVINKTWPWQVLAASPVAQREVKSL